MKHLFILDADRQPVHVEDVLEWARWFEATERSVAGSPWDAADGHVRVSTVFLGINSNFTFRVNTDAEPLLWETMIFGGAHNAYCRRYATEDAARTGHAMAILIAEGKTTPEAVAEVETALA